MTEKNPVVAPVNISKSLPCAYAHDFIIYRSRAIFQIFHVNLDFKPL